MYWAHQNFTVITSTGVVIIETLRGSEVTGTQTFISGCNGLPPSLHAGYPDLTLSPAPCTQETWLVISTFVIETKCLRREVSGSTHSTKKDLG